MRSPDEAFGDVGHGGSCGGLDLAGQPQVLFEVSVPCYCVYLTDKYSCFLPAVEVFESGDFHGLFGDCEQRTPTWGRGYR